MFSDYNGFPLLFPNLDHAAQISGGRYIQIRRWLVEDNDGRITGGHRGTSNFLLFSTRKRKDIFPQQILHVKLIHS